MKALEVSPGNWAVVDRGIIICTGFTSNEACWRWIDEHTREGRIDASRFNKNRIIFDGSGAA